MKKAIYVILVSTIISIFLTIACTIEPVTATETVNAVNLQKGKPQYITLEEAQVLIDEAVQKALSADPLVIDANVNFTKGIVSDFGPEWGTVEFRNSYYYRRETNKDAGTNIGFLEEINDRDWKVQVARGGKGSFMWIDSNPGNANYFLDINEDGGYSGIHVNNLWTKFTQNNGIYNFFNLKTFNTNEEAKAFFSANNFSSRGTIYRTPDGTVKATY